MHAANFTINTSNIEEIVSKVTKAFEPVLDEINSRMNPSETETSPEPVVSAETEEDGDWTILDAVDLLEDFIYNSDELNDRDRVYALLELYKLWSNIR